MRLLIERALGNIKTKANIVLAGSASAGAFMQIGDGKYRMAQNLLLFFISGLSRAASPETNAPGYDNSTENVAFYIVSSNRYRKVENFYELECKTKNFEYLRGVDLLSMSLRS